VSLGWAVSSAYTCIVLSMVFGMRLAMDWKC
jgi:hypothetical protein